MSDNQTTACGARISTAPGIHQVCALPILHDGDHSAATSVTTPTAASSCTVPSCVLRRDHALPHVTPGGYTFGDDSTVPPPPSTDRPTISHVEEADHPVYAAPPSGNTDSDDPWFAAWEKSLVELTALRERIEALCGNVWRVGCDCGHTVMTHNDSVCTGGLSLCPCRRSWPSIVGACLRAALVDGTP